jgi:hypothetical protein
VVSRWTAIGPSKEFDGGAESQNHDCESRRLLALMAIGGLLLVTSLWTIRRELSFARSYFLRIDGFIVATLFLVWSLILLIFPGRRLARGFRLKRANTKSESAV